jgi:hypothetical protein
MEMPDQDQAPTHFMRYSTPCQRQADSPQSRPRTNLTGIGSAFSGFSGFSVFRFFGKGLRAFFSTRPFRPPNDGILLSPLPFRSGGLSGPRVVGNNSGTQIKRTGDQYILLGAMEPGQV